MTKEDWNSFILKNDGSFLQSWEWGEFQEAIGHKIWRIEEESLRALIIKHDLPYFKNYLYCGRGPVMGREQEPIKDFSDKARQIAREEGSIFFKMEPDQRLSVDLKEFGFKKSGKEIQPSSKTIILDLNKSEGELLKEMHHKTRYNIRLAKKKELVVEQNNSQIDIFWDLIQKTSKRDKFYTHSREHYIKLMDILGKLGPIKLFLAKYKDKAIAASIILFWNKTAVYLHGASDYEYRNLMAPYLLQWQAVLEAKKQGLQFYDFWGIDEKEWPGVTRFKKGFGGEEIEYPGAFNLIFSQTWYYIYNIVRRIL